MAAIELLDAAKAGDRILVEAILAIENHIDTQDEDGNTVLNVAVIHKHLEVTKLLLNKGANINMSNKLEVTPLICACENGNLDIVDLLLRRKAEVNGADQNGFTALLKAGECGHSKVVELLLRSGAEIDRSAHDGSSALILASESGHTKTVELLLGHGADVNLLDESDYSALMVACDKGHISVIGLLTAYKADVNQINDSADSPLVKCAAGNFSEGAEILIQNGANINYTDSTGSTALFVSSQKGHKEMTEVLLRCNADANICDSSRSSPLTIASYNGSFDIVEQLLSNGADINFTDQNGWTSLNNASLEGHGNVVEQLLQHKANVNASTDDLYNPLFCAADAGNPKVVQLLMKYEANLEAVAKRDWTCLMKASVKGHREVVRLLLEGKANIHHKSVSGSSAIMKASDAGFPGVVELLLGNKADPNVIDEQEWSSLMLASQQGCPLTVQKLIEGKADVNYANKNATALMKACQMGSMEVVELLLDNGACINQAAQSNGNTALMVASKRGKLDVVVRLFAHNPQPNVNAIDSDGSTALHKATHEGFSAVVTVLLAQNADANIRNKEDKNAMRIAAEFRRIRIRNLLKMRLGTEQLLYRYSDFSSLKSIAETTFEVVYEARCTTRGAAGDVLCRVPKHDYHKWRELRLLKSVPPHPNLLKLRGVCMDFQSEANCPAVVVDRCETQTLRSFVDEHKDISEQQLCIFALDIAKSIEHLHGEDFVHQDIALRNFVVSEHDGALHCILSSYALAKHLPTQDRTRNRSHPGAIQPAITSTSTSTTSSGSMSNNMSHSNFFDESYVVLPHKHTGLISWRRAAPETLVTGNVDKYSDIWMYGIALWELISAGGSSSLPFADIAGNYEELYRELERSDDRVPLKFPEGYPNVFQELIEICCTFLHANRPTIVDIIARLREYAQTLKIDPVHFDGKEETKEIPEVYGPPNEADSVRLIELIEDENLEEITSHLVESKVNVNFCVEHHWSPLLEAVYGGDLDIVKLLVEWKADVNHCDSYVLSPLILAMMSKSEDIFKFLVSCNADVHTKNYPDAKSLWRAACVHHNFKRVKMLLACGVSSKVEINGTTAAQSSDETIAEYIGSRDSGPIQYRGTMLMWACGKGDLEMVKLITSYGVDIRSIDSRAKTAYNYAVERGVQDIVKFLEQLKRPPKPTKFFTFSELSGVKQIKGSWRARINVLYEESMWVTCSLPKSRLPISELFQDGNWPELDMMLNIPGYTHIPTFFGICMDFHVEERITPAIVLSYQPAVLHQEIVTPDELFHLGLQMGKGVHHLHSNGYIHRNIACSKFLYGEDGKTAVLTDFSMAIPANQDLPGLEKTDLPALEHINRNMEDGGGNRSESVAREGMEQKCADPNASPEIDFRINEDVTSNNSDIRSPSTDTRNKPKPRPQPTWRCYAPETLSSGVFTTKSDIWMFGIALWQLWGNIVDPFSAIKTKEELLEKLNSQTPISLLFPNENQGNQPTCPRPFWKIINLCCLVDPENRIKAEDIVKQLTTLAQGVSKGGRTRHRVRDSVCFDNFPRDFNPLEATGVLEGVLEEKAQEQRLSPNRADYPLEHGDSHMSDPAKEDVIMALATIFDASCRVLTSPNAEEIDAQIVDRLQKIHQESKEIQLLMESMEEKSPDSAPPLRSAQSSSSLGSGSRQSTGDYVPSPQIPPRVPGSGVRIRGSSEGQASEMPKQAPGVAGVPREATPQKTPELKARKPIGKKCAGKKPGPDVEITIVRGINLVPDNFLGKPDLYCLIKALNHEGHLLSKNKTQVLRNERDPRWGDIRGIWKHVTEIDKIEVEVYNWNRWGRDSFLGACFLTRREMTGKKMKMKLLTSNFEVPAKHQKIKGFLELKAKIR